MDRRQQCGALVSTSDAQMIDVFLESAHEAYVRIRKSGLRGLGADGWIIVLGFLLLLLAFGAALIGIFLS